MDTPTAPRSAADGPLPADDTAPGTPGDLDQRLSGALERMGHVTRTLLARQAYLEGLSPLQLQLLRRLASGARTARVSDLANELDVSQATISDALKTMLGKGLLAKERDVQDRRSIVLSLTHEGNELLARLGQWTQPLEAKLQLLDEADKGTALRLVLRLIADLHLDGVINVARTCMTCVHFDDTTHPDSSLPYHCHLLETAFAETELRVDCHEHQPRSA